MSLPGASELFRPTQSPTTQSPTTQSLSSGAVASPAPPIGDTPIGDTPPADTPSSAPADTDPRGTGRVRHDEKITVYVSADELVALEQARLTLRARHGVAVDRGRIVREAIAATIADLEARGDDSELIRRLSLS